MKTTNIIESNTNNKISRLIGQFSKYNVEGYLLSSTDQYQGEYTSEYNNRVKYFTGFTGSFAVVFIFKDKGYFFTDGRYITQANKELDLNFYKVFNIIELKSFAWANDISNKAIGYDPMLFSVKFLKSLSPLILSPIRDNLIDNIWHDRNNKLKSECYIYSLKYAGKSWEEKLSLIRSLVEPFQYLFLTNSEAICWLLNIRARDQEFSPILNCYALISPNQVHVFTDLKNVPQNIIDYFNDKVTFIEEKLVIEYLQGLGQKVLIDTQQSPSHFVDILGDKVVHKQDPSMMYKAQKNDAEISNFIDIHIKDAVSLCEFLAYLEEMLGLGLTIDEYNLSLKLTEFRSKDISYIMDSFSNICGYEENSSIIHYRPKRNDSKMIKPKGILLIDSGGHYFGGTTDITRTISLGGVSQEQRHFYTKVLKGHIALVNIIFPDGTSGANLDVLARQYLWKQGLDYPHGTGHGVGNALNVHEGPQAISRNNNVELKLNMIVSNEPGYYIPGKYGIRIENLIYVTNSTYENFLAFKNLTLVPYDINLIDKDLLSQEEISYISSYYSEINSKIKPLLSTRAKKWLESHVDEF